MVPQNSAECGFDGITPATQAADVHMDPAGVEIPPCSGTGRQARVMRTTDIPEHVMT